MWQLFARVNKNVNAVKGEKEKKYIYIQKLQESAFEGRRSSSLCWCDKFCFIQLVNHFFYPFIVVPLKMRLKSAETQFYATLRYITYKCRKIIIKRIANWNESTSYSLGQLIVIQLANIFASICKALHKIFINLKVLKCTEMKES